MATARARHALGANGIAALWAAVLVRVMFE
jgi:hypothetical protein